MNVPVGFSPSPFPTVPFSLRSMCQLSVSPALFFKVKAKTALADLRALLRAASSALRASLMASKASEAGKEAVMAVSGLLSSVLVVSHRRKHATRWAQQTLRGSTTNTYRS